MPEFKVHYVEKSDTGVQVESLPAFEAYGEILDTLRDAMIHAYRRSYRAIRIYLCTVDYERLQKQIQRQHGVTLGGDTTLRMNVMGYPVDCDVRVYEPNDTAQPGNAMMVIQRH